VLLEAENVLNRLVLKQSALDKLINCENSSWLYICESQGFFLVLFCSMHIMDWPPQTTKLILSDDLDHVPTGLN
jgi:hypothetical protein